MLPELKLLLNKLEQDLDFNAQGVSHASYIKALRWEKTNRLPLVINYPLPDDIPYKPFPYRETFDDPEKMLFNELLHAFSTSIFLHPLLGDDLPYTIRANYGTGIIASLFGAKIELVEDNPPWVRNLDKHALPQRVLDADPSDMQQGLLPKVVKTCEFYRETLNNYPNLQRCVNIVLPDLQGPFDTIELLYGSEIYPALYEEPEIITKMMANAAQMQINAAKYLNKLTVEHFSGFIHQHATVLPGNILIRNDSAINLSPEMYANLVAPHDAFVLNAMNGGGIHFCGCGQHLVPEFLKHRSLTCLDLGQPHLNNIAMIYALAAERPCPLIRMQMPEEELLSANLSARFPTGITLVHAAASFKEAKHIFNRYKNLLS